MKKLLLVLLFLIIGYIIGSYIPLNGPIIISDAEISKSEYYSNIINSFVTFGTCAAVIVALFLTEIRSWFKKVNFNIQLHNADIIEDLIDNKGSKKAIRYYNSIQIFNKGNINAQYCELYLERAEYYKGQMTNTPLDLAVQYTAIDWGNVNNNVYIPCQGKKVLHIFEILAPKKQSTPDGGENKIPPKMKILGLLNSDGEISAGCIVLTYCLYSINAKPKKFKFIVTWNGNWEERQAEMKNALTTKLEMV